MRPGVLPLPGSSSSGDVTSGFLRTSHRVRPVCSRAEGEEARVGAGCRTDLREFRDPVSAEELEQFETDVLAGFVLARASAGLADGTIHGDVGHLDQVRAWSGQPLWETSATTSRRPPARAVLPGAAARPVLPRLLHLRAAPRGRTMYWLSAGGPPSTRCGRQHPCRP